MKKIVLLIFILGALTACEKKEGLELEDCFFLVEVTRTEEISSLGLLARLNVESFALKAIIPRKTIKIVSIKYRTFDEAGQTIIASGIIAYSTTLSEERQRGGILGLHFTVSSNAEVPSVCMAVHEAMFAAFDYVVVAPDYIGYGSTADIVHPYHHANLTGSASLDMYSAAKEYFATKAKRLSRNVTVMGYSEGGYASLATLKMVQEASGNGIIDLGVKEVFAGAGAYDLVASYDDFIAKNYSSQPGTCPMLMLGLNYGDKLNLDFSKMFSPKLLENYQEWILSKQYTNDEVNQLIGSTKLTDFLTPEVFDKNHPNTLKFRESLEKNSLVKMKPTVPVMLFHSKDDMVVPYANTENAYNSFKGMPGVNVSLVTIEGKDHMEAGEEFYLQCMLRILNLKK